MTESATPAAPLWVTEVFRSIQGEYARNLEENLGHLKGSDEVKLVMTSRADYEWSRGLVQFGRFGGRAVLDSPGRTKRYEQSPPDPGTARRGTR